MVQDLADFAADEPIFIDANIFLFQAFDDEEMESPLSQEVLAEREE